MSSPADSDTLDRVTEPAGSHRGLLRRLQEYLRSALTDPKTAEIPIEVQRDADQLLGCLPTADGSDAEILHTVGLLGYLHHSAEPELTDRGYESVIQLLTEAVRRSDPDDPGVLDRALDLGAVGVEWYERRPVRADLDAAVGVLRTVHETGPAGRAASRAPLLTGLAHQLAEAGSVELAEEAMAVLDHACRDIGDTSGPVDAVGRDELVAAAGSVLGALRGRPDARRDGMGDRIVGLARRAVADGDPDDLRHPWRLLHLAVVLGLRDDGEAATEAVGLLCRCIPALIVGEPVRTFALVELGNRLFAAGATLPDSAIDAAEAMLARQAPGMGDGDPDQPALLVARIAGQRALLTRRDGGVADRLRELATTLAAVMPPGPERDRVLGTVELAWPPRDREEEHTRQQAAGEVLLERIATAPDHHPLLRMWLGDLADLLRHRCAEDPSPPVVREAIEVHRRLLGMDDRRDPERTLALAELLQRQYQLDRDRAALVESGELLHGILRSTGPDSPTHAEARAGFSAAIIDLAGLDGSAELVDLAEESALALIHDGCPEHGLPAAWHNVANARMLRHGRSGDGLAEAIDAARQAVRLGPATDEAGVERQLLLAQLLAVDGQVAEAVALVEGAVGWFGDRPLPPRVAAGHATVLAVSHGRFGDPADLDRTIARERSIVATSDPVTAAIARGRLAAGLRVRFERTGDLATLEEAITHYREALRVLPEPNRMRPVLQSNLVVAMHWYARRTGDPDRVAEAVAASRALVTATAPEDPAFAHRLMTLGSVLGMQFESTGDRALLDEAVAAQRRAVDLTPPGHPHLGLRYSVLAFSLTRMVILTANRDVAEAAVEAAAQAVTNTPEDHAQRANRLVNLAAMISTAGTVDMRSPSPAAAWRTMRRMPEAIRAAEAAARTTTAPPAVRLRACRVWGLLAATARRWPAAADAYALGVEQLPLVARRNLRRTDAEYLLAGVDADHIVSAADQLPAANNVVHLAAAACAIRAGDAERALTVLEQGRGVLASYALDARTDLTDLEAAAPDLAAEWTLMLDELDDVQEPLLDEFAEQATDHRHELALRWDQLLSRIRAVPGCAGFAAPLRLSSLLPAAAGGPVVVVNVSALGCHALIVTSDAVRALKLRRLHDTEVDQRARAFLVAVERPDGGGASEATIRDTLGWLWDSVAEPVLTALGHRAAAGGGTWPHVWWSPTGLLQFLPLHAAGRHRAPGDSVLDRVVSSYTPTLRALLHARARPAAGETPLLAVAMSRTPGEAPLPSTTREARDLARVVPRAQQLTDDDAGYQAVLAELGRCGRVHFACHAVSDPHSPSASRLLLHDRPLAVRDIARLRLDRAEFAFLSACSTAPATTGWPTRPSTWRRRSSWPATATSSAPCGRSRTRSRRRSCAASMRGSWPAHRPPRRCTRWSARFGPTTRTRPRSGPPTCTPGREQPRFRLATFAGYDWMVTVITHGGGGSAHRQPEGGQVTCLANPIPTTTTHSRLRRNRRFARRARWPSPASSERRSSGTTSSSSARPRPWCSTRCSSRRSTR